MVAAQNEEGIRSATPGGVHLKTKYLPPAALEEARQGHHDVHHDDETAFIEGPTSD